MTSSNPPRPFLTAAIIAIAAQALFLFGVTTPHKLVFDEVHYVPAARTLMALSGPANIEHPLLGKELIAAGMLLFGDDSFGWRFFSTIAGTGIVLGVFAILWLAFGRVRTAAFGAALVLLNFTVFVQARIAMLDGFMATFVVGGIAAMLWAMRAPPRRVWPRWLFGRMLLGLGVGAKWVVLPFIAYAGAALLIVRFYDARSQKQSIYAALNGTAARHWPGLPVVPALLALGVVSLGTYVLTFAPAFFYAHEPLTLGQLLPFHARMSATQ